MDGKIPLLFGYLCLLVFFAATPWTSIVDGSVQRTPARRKALTAALFVTTLAAFTLAFIPRHASWMWLALVLGFVAFSSAFPLSERSLQKTLTLAIASCLMTSLLWWVDLKAITWIQTTTAIAIVGISSIGFWLAKPRASPHQTFDAALVVLAGLICWVVMYMGAFEARSHVVVAWHHWGAYLGPVETMKAGLIPFSDIPLQYGLGPTLLLALAPSSTGFDGMRWVVTGMTLIGICTVVDLCLLGVRPLHSYFVSCVAALAGAIACLLWVASPPSVGSAMITPSTFGLRFVPAFVLIWTLIRFPAQLVPSLIVWALCMVWSIECAFYACVIFWPTRLKLAMTSTFIKPLKQVTAVGGQAILVVTVLALLWWFVYWNVFGINPTPRLYILYALYPPGPLPVNWVGPVWWLLFLLLITALVLHSKDAGGTQKRTIHICALGAVAFVSYYLGRSHDNNIINLMPSAVMLICALIGGTAKSPALSAVARLLLAGTVALLPFFGFETWADMKPAQIHAWSKNMSFGRSASQDLKSAIDYIRDDRREYFEVVDTGPLNFEAYGPNGVWNALHPLSNYPFVPSDDRRDFLRKGIKKIGKPGWLIVEKSRIHDPIVLDFLLEYDSGESIAFGNYIAMRMTPRVISTGAAEPR